MPRTLTESHQWVAAATIDLDVRQASRGVHRGTVRIPEATKIEVLEVYCFTGDTMCLTMDGPEQLGDLAGTSPMLLTQHFRVDGPDAGSRRDGRWVQAPVESFGVQPVLTVTLTRGVEQKQVRATRAHRWLVAHSGSGPYRTRVTQDLRSGMVLASLTPGDLGLLPPSPGDRLQWRVESVDNGRVEEEVFCAVVPDTHTFALDDFIWTHNCAMCRRPYEDVVGQPCSAFDSTEHLRGGPIGERAKRLHPHHDCEKYGCTLGRAIG
jgi:hypothetical protein